MKRTATITIRYDEENEVFDAILSTETGEVTIASTDPRDFTGFEQERAQKAAIAALDEAHEVLAALAWRSPESATRDGSRILADFGHPGPTIAAWSCCLEKWIIAEDEQIMYRRKPEPSFISEIENDETLKRWQPLPK